MDNIFNIMKKYEEENNYLSLPFYIGDRMCFFKYHIHEGKYLSDKLYIFDEGVLIELKTDLLVDGEYDIKQIDYTNFDKNKYIVELNNIDKSAIIDLIKKYESKELVEIYNCYTGEMKEDINKNIAYKKIAKAIDEKLNTLE